LNIGYHYIWDVHGCEESKISYEAFVSNLLYEIVGLLELSEVKSAFKQFQPKGVTGFILLEESHISIHTWPEHKFAAIDLFSCKPIDTSSLEAYLLQSLNATHITESSIKRGKAPVSYPK
jgi:S-adenosylmethionine decarboxylase